MSSSLASRQGILRRSINRLSSLLHDHRDLLAQRLDSGQEPGAGDRKVLLRTAKRAETAIHLERERLESAIDKYTSTADNLDANVQIPSDTLEKVETNVEAAHELLDEALTALTTLTVLQQELGSLEVTHSSETPVTSCISNMKLAPIPVPKFSGEIWEWETFWKSFEHSVDSKNIDDIYKLNYLLDSLQGRVRESVKHFEVSGAAYPLVVAYLKNKYDDKEALIERLLHNLQFARARTNRLEDQEALCEELQSIVSQLKIKGEHVDNVFLQRQLINKFSPEVQRHVIRQKTKDEAEGSWNTLTLLLIAKEYIRGELRVTRQMKQCTICDTSQEISSNPYETQHRKIRQNLCFYCGKSGHQPVNCNEATSLKQRLQIIKTQKLCRNCGRKDHIAANCTGGTCRLCRESGHHTSICEKLNLLPSDETPIPKTNASIRATTNPQTIKSSTAKNLTSTSALEHPKPQDIPSLENSQYPSEVQVLVGQARVLNPTTAELEEIYVMLDTGADRSFITDDLADRLQLKVVSATRLEINTFGSRKPMKKTYTNTVLRMWDMEGTEHEFTVTCIDTITTPLKRSSLSTEDKKFLTENNIHVSIDPSIKKLQPAVLLGCADLFSVLDVGLKTEYTLPSGLKLIPSRLGYLITGRNSAQRNGTHEFTGPASEERRLTNAAIWKRFQESIEKREDGYYVRLPWKSNSKQLPDNKQLAYRRLKANLIHLPKNSTILQQYHDTILDQLERGIIEEVSDDQPSGEEIVHYSAHHAVITPQKDTTKLRIVFDASAHLKNCPSLNDVLNQGPVILPKSCDILLRFRIGDTAIISDVEKAFLQVRLHPSDRNATRFMWVRDIRKPLTKENSVTYRFTRVTFGLNCSPFLLAGTINHHLRTMVQDIQLAKEIEDNIYVDNLILTTSSTSEALKIYQDTKKIFNALNMNLRQFQSNSSDLKNQITPTDLCQSEKPKYSVSHGIQ
uniref:CCHC-type domain-containing protein n=1 Tax=Haemonchus contortus TaxID=6289 RepID=A0A7I5E549_HAECO